MNCLIQYQTLLRIPLYALLLVWTSTGLVAQEDVHVNVANFSMLVETTIDDITLTCTEGCAWEKLNFSATIHSEPQAVDQDGMTTLPGNRNTEESHLADFLFTIKRTREGVSLEGKNGTIWPSLTLDCPDGTCLRRIDGWGMADNNKK